MTSQMWFHDMATHYVEAQVLFHLNQAGVLRMLLERAPITAASLSEQLGLVPEMLEVLLDYVRNVDHLITGDARTGYELTDFGRHVLERYGRVDPDGGRHINLFDVRVGAYGPIWAALEGMLRGDVVYQRDLHRKGAIAAEATYKISPRIAPMVERFARERRVERLVEIGVPTGMLACLSGGLPGVDLVGLDIDQGAIEEARSRAVRSGADRIRFVQGDVFEAGPWAHAVAGGRGAFFTVHLHELASRGWPAIRAMLTGLAEHFPGFLLLAIEQDRLPDESRATLPRDEWLYSQSNVLIHHVIKNARILRREEWLELLTCPRSKVIACEPVGYLGYHGYVVELSGRDGFLEVEP